MCKNYTITPKRERKQKKVSLHHSGKGTQHTTQRKAKAIQHKHNTTKNNKSKYTTNNK